LGLTSCGKNITLLVLIVTAMVSYTIFSIVDDTQL